MGERPEAWYYLRATRADPPVHPEAYELTRRTYQASLQQAEELWIAARATGPAGRPLPLFYSLAQAGRAVVAARGGAEADNHGLQGPKLAKSILKSTVRPAANGWFQKVADATGSDPLPEGVELEALMASLPEMSDRSELTDHWLPALPVWSGPFPVEVLTSGFQQLGQMYRVPAVVVFQDLPGSADRLKEALKPYPDAAGAEPTLQRWSTSRGDGYVLGWPRSAPSIDPLPPPYGPDGFRWMRPNLPLDARPPSLLMTWWAVLFTLSMLARYHPVRWADALDPDRSPAAVLLERTMEVALEVVPQLVLEAIMATGSAGGSASESGRP